MTTKADLLRNVTSCLNKADPGEPVFLLRAKDPLAAQTVRLWAAMAQLEHGGEKVAEARHLADEMDAWNQHNIPSTACAAPINPAIYRK